MYLKRLKRLKLIPNFWCSEEYFKRAGWVQYSNANGIFSILKPDEDEAESKSMIHVLDEDSYNMLPPLSPSGLGGRNTPYWAGFHLKFSCEEVLDLNYIYNPIHFRNLQGKCWSAFRKNIKKWPSNNPNDCYRKIEEYERDQVVQVFLDWLESRNQWEEIHDGQIITSYLKESDNCRGLFRGEELVGFTIHDENWSFINFRYCFSKAEPFLNEYIRYRFFTSPEIWYSGKLVNDGGVLDNPRLKFFKDRLNPVTVYSIPTKEI